MRKLVWEKGRDTEGWNMEGEGELIGKGGRGIEKARGGDGKGKRGGWAREKGRGAKKARRRR